MEKAIDKVKRIKSESIEDIKKLINMEGKKNSNLSSKIHEEIILYSMIINRMESILIKNRKYS